MKFTGERFIPTEQGKIRLEHYHRYAAVEKIVAGKLVLDVASGEGYGSYQLANFASKVTGVDISHDAIQHASATYVKRNLEYMQGSATALPFRDNVFDVVISFETIEHLHEQAQMLAEICRVLSSNGVLVISSPNRPVYSEESGEHNEYHVKELDFLEFNDLLLKQFSDIQYFGQRTQMGSVIQPVAGGGNAYKAWHDDGENLHPNSGQMLNPVYFLAVCSNIEVAIPAIEASVLYPDKLDLVKHYVGFARWAQSQNQELETLHGQLNEYHCRLEELQNQVKELRSQITDERSILAKREVHIDVLTGNLNRRAEWIRQIINRGRSERDKIFLNAQTERLHLTAELEAERNKIAAIVSSDSWKVTLPLREISRWISTPKKQVMRYISIVQKIVYRIRQKKSRTAYIADMENTTNLYGRRSLSCETQIEKNIFLNEQIEFAISLKPILSIVIPIYGKIDYTLQCLRSIALYPPSQPYEIIVINDCSPDKSALILASCCKEVKVIENSTNQGFIKSCNVGAKASLGKYLLFLNNDTQVTDGWADALLRTFQEFPGTGLVGSKLVYPNGDLQEAGGIIWGDGQIWNYGRNQNPDLPVFNYAREVDYCSGASILVPKVLFDSIGGFSEHYLPAYCEDCDLALTIRDKGYRVIYQPMSKVIHHEGISSGTDTSSGVKSYQIENTKKLFKRWDHILRDYQHVGHDLDNAKDRTAKQRVLVIDACTPTPDQDAGSLVAFNFMLLLREMDFQVTFIAADNFLYMPDYTEDLQRRGVEVLYAPYINTVDEHLVEYGGRYRLAFLFRPDIVHNHLEAIRVLAPQAKVLYSTVDLHYVRMTREAELLSDPLKLEAANNMKVRELACIQSVDATIVHSESELALLKPILPYAKIFTFPLIMNSVDTCVDFFGRKNIIFVGGYQHVPNVDAVCFFVESVMPLLRRRLPGVHFYIVGSKAPQVVLDLQCEDVHVVGFVDELGSMFDSMKLSVAPLRFGAGIKGKIGSSLAHGLPVVATNLAVEGMGLSAGQDVMIGDSPEEMMDAIVEVYTKEALWVNLSQRGQKFIDSNWSGEATWRLMANIVEDLGISVHRRNRPLSLYENMKHSKSTREIHSQN